MIDKEKKGLEENINFEKNIILRTCFDVNFESGSRIELESFINLNRESLCNWFFQPVDQSK